MCISEFTEFEYKLKPSGYSFHFVEYHLSRGISMKITNTSTDRTAIKIVNRNGKCHCVFNPCTSSTFVGGTTYIFLILNLVKQMD